jgi:hypothetical protein
MTERSSKRSRSLSPKRTSRKSLFEEEEKKAFITPAQARKLLRFSLQESYGEPSPNEDYDYECSEVEGDVPPSMGDESEEDEERQVRITNKILADVAVVTRDLFFRAPRPVGCYPPDYYSDCLNLAFKRLLPDNMMIIHKELVFLIPRSEETFAFVYSVMDEFEQAPCWEEDLTYSEIEEPNPPCYDFMRVEQHKRLLFSMLGDCPSHVISCGGGSENARKHAEKFCSYKIEEETDDGEWYYPLNTGEMTQLAGMYMHYFKYEVAAGTRLPPNTVLFYVPIK